MACICPSGGPQTAPHLRHLRLLCLQLHVALLRRLIRLHPLQGAATATRLQRLVYGDIAVQMAADLAVLVYHACLHTQHTMYVIVYMLGCVHCTRMRMHISW